MLKPTLIFSLFFCLLSLTAVSQRKSATVSGKVVDENEQPLSGVSIVVLGRQTGITSNDTGFFLISVPADRAFALVFSYSGYRQVQRNFFLNDKEKETIVVRMEKGAQTLE